MIVSDRAIRWRIRQAAIDYENGAILEARDKLVSAVNMIDLLSALKERKNDDDKTDTDNLPDSFKHKFMRR